MSFLIGQKATANLEPILFKIEPSSETLNAKPFADIRTYSDFPEESEVLFMIGSIFRLDEISRSKDGQVWITQMALCGDDEHDLQGILADMKQQYEREKMNLRTLGKFLWEIGKLGMAEKYLMRLLEQLPSNHPLLGTLYMDLSQLASQNRNYNKSIEWRLKAVALKNQNLSISKLFIKKTSNADRKVH